jgi:hypothetical protein
VRRDVGFIFIHVYERIIKLLYTIEEWWVGVVLRN